MSSKAVGTPIGNSASNIDSNQPIDLAQKSHGSNRLIEMATSTSKGSNATLVNISPLSSNASTHQILMQKQNVLKAGSVTISPTPAPTNMKGNSPPMAHAGYHIPIGPAYAANVAAPRSQNVTVRTTSQGSSASALSKTGGRSTGRFLPVVCSNLSNSNWQNKVAPTMINKSSTVLNTNIPSNRSGNTVGSIASFKANITPLNKPTATVRTGIAEASRVQTTKGLNITHTISSPKYVKNNICTSKSDFSPSSTLVTSLASSGTTITPHSGTRVPQPTVSHTTARPQHQAIAVRITSAISSSSPHISQQSSNSLGAITLSATSVPQGAILTPHQSRNSDHIPVKPPIVRTPSSGLNKLNSPMSAQITFPNSKIISHQTPYVHKSPSPFQARSSTPVGITRMGIPMAKVIPHTAPSIVHPPTTSSAVTIVGAHLPTTVAHSTPTTETHNSVVIHRSISGVSRDKVVTSVSQYNIATPYYIESSNSPIASQNVVTNFIPTTTTLRIPSASNNENISSVPFKPNSSPRPSILRRSAGRTDFEGSPSKAVKNLTAVLSSSPPSPKRHEGNGNISSTDSANSSPGTEDEEKGKDREQDDSAQSSSLALSLLSSRTFINKEKSTAVTNHVPLNIPNLDGMSPRKKPRKQQLMGNELQETSTFHTAKIDSTLYTTEIDYSPPKKFKKDLDSPNAIQLNLEEMEVSSDSSTPEPKRRPMSLMSTYKQEWKARLNHFIRPTDVKQKEEKKKTVTEIANQKMVTQKANGWKIIHLTGQFEDLVDLETDVSGRLKNMLSVFESIHPLKSYKDIDKDVNKLSELYKANIQRSISVADQVSEGRHQINKLFDHKANIADILSKYSNKRVIRQKQRP